jgi:hypothetical protein
MSAFRKLDIAAFLAQQSPQNFSSFSNFSSPEVAPPQSGTDGESDAVKALVAPHDPEERAAIVQEGSGAPREWAEAFARLDAADPPKDIPPARWEQFIDDAGRFLDQGWAVKAKALGWSPLELFGCDRPRPLARTDNTGLIWVLRGRRLLALTAETATIENTNVPPHKYRRCINEPGRAVLAWELLS